MAEKTPKKASPAPANKAAKGPARLTPAARRALVEAEQRRKSAARTEKDAAREVGGRDGPDPVRYGDWEKDGIISDF